MIIIIKNKILAYEKDMFKQAILAPLTEELTANSGKIIRN